MILLILCYTQPIRYVQHRERVTSLSLDYTVAELPTVNCARGAVLQVNTVLRLAG